MSQYGYGGRQNPYDQRGGSPAQGGYSQPYGAPQQSYGRTQYDAPPAMGRDDYSGQNVEMEPLTGNGAQFGRQNNPNAILDECREIDRGIATIYQNLDSITQIQQRILSDPDTSINSGPNRQLDTLNAETMTMYRNFTGRLKSIKQKPESGSAKNAPQVGRVDRALKEAINKYQNVDVSFQKQLKEQMARQYRIVRPEASEAEVREAVEDTSNQQVFSQALLQSDRRGQARSALGAVENRHQAIQKIERQMIELAELFQDMENLVVQQEAAVTNIELKGEEVVENMDKGTEQIGVAIKSARNARKWKWWCLGICVLIIIIIVIVVLIYKFVIQGNGSNNNKAAKRFVLDNILSERGLPGTSFHETFVRPGVPWNGGSGSKMVRAVRERRFVA